MEPVNVALLIVFASGIIIFVAQIMAWKSEWREEDRRREISDMFANVEHEIQELTCQVNNINQRLADINSDIKRKYDQ